MISLQVSADHCLDKKCWIICFFLKKTFFQAQKNNIKLELVDDTYTKLRGEISGPPDTPYEGKLWFSLSVSETTWQSVLLHILYN